MYSIFRCFEYCIKNTKSLYFSNYFFSVSKHLVIKNMNAKPPNILVYTGCDCPKLFKNIEDDLLKCLKTDYYVIYPLLSSEINKQPWMENTLLLIISCDVITGTVEEIFETYIKNFGNTLILCSKFNHSFLGNKCFETPETNNLVQISYKGMTEIFVHRGKYSYQPLESSVLCSDNNGHPVIHKTVYGKNILITSEIYLLRDSSDTVSNTNQVLQKYCKKKCLWILKDILTEEFGLKGESNIPKHEFSAGYYITDFHQGLRNMNCQQFFDTSLTKPIFCECIFRSLDNEIKLPVYYSDENVSKLISFDKDLYFSKLNTDLYGHHLVYFPVVTSTMEVAEQLSEYEGIVVVADFQTNGRGRYSNKWISPAGCAMFTLHFTLSINSFLGQQLSLLQHIASLAVVHGIRSQPIYKELNIQIKWPNDIYYNKIKIGGLIVTSVVQKGLAHINIGWGIDVANQNPTSCINDVIQQYNLENCCSLPYLRTEEIIAHTVSQMEFFVKDFIKSGPDKFFMHYYLYWMHDHQKVTLANLNEEGTITGLNEYGFLIVESVSGKKLILQPDGNRFDIMKNLIYSK